MTRLRVIGVGRLTAGDDGAGLEVVARLRLRLKQGKGPCEPVHDSLQARQQPGAAHALELHTVAEPSALVELLWTPDPVVIVDALRCSRTPGSLAWLALGDLASSHEQTTSHGFSVHQACQLARTLDEARFTPRLALLGIAIEEAQRGKLGLSPAVEAGVEAAAHDLLYRVEPPVPAAASPR